VSCLSLTPGEGAVAFTTEEGVDASPPSIVLKEKNNEAFYSCAADQFIHTGLRQSIDTEEHHTISNRFLYMRKKQ
jgi:hypothetical protein